VQRDEPGVAALPGRRDQHVDRVRELHLDVVGAQRGRTGDHATGAGVQQGGHLLLQGRRRSVCRQVHPGQQRPPQPARPEPVPQRVIGNADGKRLETRDYVKLLDEKPVEGVMVQPGCSGHVGIMRATSDKHPPHKTPFNS